MSWDLAMVALNAHLVAAGATLSPKVTTIWDGEPNAVNGPLFASWYAGDRESTSGGNSLSKTNIEEGVVVTIYWPTSVRFPSGAMALERWLRAAVRAVKHELWADTDLGGNAIGIDVGDASATWDIPGGALCRIARFTLWVDEAWVDDIAP